MDSCSGAIVNCIIWDNSSGILEGQMVYCSTPNYSCIEDWIGGGVDNISDDPLFANSTNDDYHLKTEHGRWDPNSNQWIYDDVSSPCIDAGDPTSVEWKNELWPHGGRINMGAYGGTSQASMSPKSIGNMTDLDHDAIVSLSDFGLFTRDWQKTEYLLDTDFDLNGIVDINDLAEMGSLWLWKQGPFLDVSETQFSLVYYEGLPSSHPQTLTISNPGGGTINWYADLTAKPYWLSIAPTNGSLVPNESEDVTISYDTSGLTNGQYSYTFEVTDPAAQNSPQSITLRLRIATSTYVPGTYPTIQAAIDAAGSNDNTNIVVSPGTYYETIRFNGKNIILTSTNPEDPNIVETTIIKGRNVGGGVYFSGSETPNCKLSGFTIKDTFSGSGGGIYGNGTQATIEHCIIAGCRGYVGGGLSDCYGPITNCTITGNKALVDYGGGLYNCDGPITNCTITDNTTDAFGGGLYNCDGPITNCTITGNTAGEDGGGLYNCNASITNCTITDNTTDACGGGLYNCDGPITNCTITGNTAGWDGGGVVLCYGPINNCTIANNLAGWDGGGVYYCTGPITNCIIWHNFAGDWGDQLYSSSTPTYSCIQDWTGGGTGNINSDPNFVDAANNDYHLNLSSPCIDAGTNSPPGGLPTMDIEGDPRPSDGDGDGSSIADMGAYELQSPPDNPYLIVSPTSFFFSTFEGQNNPDSQSIIIKNLGNQTLNWSADLTNIPGWLTVTPISGSLELGESETVTLSVDITALPEGQYNYSFDVTDPTAQNSPQTINIDLEVVGPILDISSNTFAFTALEDGSNPNSQTVTISNPGGGTVNWSADLTGKPAWLMVTPISGTLGHNESEDVTLSVNISGLTAGQYSYAFEVSDPAAANSPQTVTLELEVVQPELDISSNTFNVIAFEAGENPDPNILTISNPGGGTVNWSADLTGKPAWLMVTPISGTLGHNESEDVTLSVNISGLTAGQYSYAFEVSDPAAANSPQIVTVNLELSNLSQGLTAHWKLDGNFLDSSGNTYDGTFHDDNASGMQWVSGIDNQAIDLDGVDDYVAMRDEDAYSFTSGSNIDKLFTISAWINFRI